MGAKSSISWTQSSWSPLRARVKDNAAEIARIKGYKSLVQIAGAMAGHVGHHCEHASTECLNCYSESNNGRCLPHNGTGLPFDRRSRDLIDPIVDQKILLQPLSWRKPRKIFVESQSDLFGEWYTDEMIEMVFGVMRLCERHRFQVLTKRADRMFEWFKKWSGKNHCIEVTGAGTGSVRSACWIDPLPNVDLGVSAGTQKAADERIPLLLQTPAAVRWVSIEPQLEAVALKWDWLSKGHPYGGGPMCDLSRPWEEPKEDPGLDWIVIGGESGRNARPFRIEWAEFLIAQCRSAGVAPFLKQLGSNPIWAGVSCAPIEPSCGKNDDPEQWPESLRVQEWPS